MTKFSTKTYRYTIDNDSLAKVGEKPPPITNKKKRMVPRQAEGEEVENSEFQ